MKERLAEYRKPTQGTLQEYIIREALIDNDGADLYVCYHNISVNSLRTLENKEIKYALSLNMKILHRISTPNPYLAQLANGACKKLIED